MKTGPGKDLIQTQGSLALAMVHATLTSLALVTLGIMVPLARHDYAQRALEALSAQEDTMVHAFRRQENAIAKARI